MNAAIVRGIAKEECLKTPSNLAHSFYQFYNAHLCWVTLKISAQYWLLNAEAVACQTDISMLRSCDTAQFESIWILQTSSLACNGDQPSVLLLHLLCFRGKGASWCCSVARVLPVSLMPGPNEAYIMPQLAEAWSRQRILTQERKNRVLLEARLDFYLPLSTLLHLPPPTHTHTPVPVHVDKFVGTVLLAMMFMLATGICIILICPTYRNISLKYKYSLFSGRLKAVLCNYFMWLLIQKKFWATFWLYASAHLWNCSSHACLTRLIYG